MEHARSLDFGLLLNSVQNGILAIDLTGAIVYCNSAAERIFGIAAHSARDRHIAEVLPDASGKLLACLQAGHSICGEKLVTPNAILLSNIDPIRADGQIVGVIGVFQEIADARSAVKELNLLKESKAWLDAVIDSSFDGITITDREGTIIRYNRAAERVNGTRGDELIGRNLKDLIAEGRVDRVLTFEVVRTKRTVTIIQRNRAGKRLLCTGNPIFDETGEVAFVVTNERDLQELDTLRTEVLEMQALAMKSTPTSSDSELKGVDLSGLILRSREMQRVVNMAIRVAGADSTILLSGESGTGKGVIAKLIHEQSARRRRPFIRVDCAGVPDSLIESELFGYEKGAFTGAKTEGKPGLLELANGGTLFLDEIAELPMNSQAKLLRFLEDREIVRVGGTMATHIDARIITATNKNLEEMVSAERFRGDLFYRLNTIPIHIPPLRERRDDVLPLIVHFLQKFNERYQRKRTLSPATVDILSRYDFPGNTRELANLVERLVVLSEEDCIEPHDLPDSITGLHDKIDFLRGLPEDAPLKELMERFEGYVIEKAVRKHGSQRKAARMLGIDHATIGRKLKKFCVPQDGAVVHP